MTEMTQLLTVPAPGAAGYYILLILLFAGPVSIAVGALLPPRAGRPFLLAALVFLGLETAFIFLSVSYQNALARLRDGIVLTMEVEGTGFLLETRAMFLGLFAIYVAVLCIPLILHRMESRLFSTALPLSFLVLYSAGTVFWLTTAAVEGP